MHPLVSPVAPRRSFVFSLWLALGSLVPVYATPTEVIADPKAPGHQQPQIGSAGNDVAVVNIQRTGDDGVSYNALSKLNVGPEGIVFNNSRESVQTQLAGWIAANPNLVDRSADVIIGAVNSSDPSLLKGFLEIGGPGAQLVISNPSGITCDGCGFINATRATLTTGAPQFNDAGRFSGYQVRGGEIIVGALGMNASSAEMTELFARAVKIAGQLKAHQQKSLTVMAGANAIDQDGRLIERITPDSRPSPKIAIDISAYSGLSAGSILMIANECGVGACGVGIPDEIALTPEGRIVNRGLVRALFGNVTIQANHLDNRGTIAASEHVHIHTTHLNQQGQGALLADLIAIQAQSVTLGAENGQAALMAARRRVDLGVKKLLMSEHALLMSDGEMVIGDRLDDNQQATGRADSVTLSSARIEVDKLTMYTRDLKLINAHFRKELQQEPGYPQTIEEYQGSGASRRYATHAPGVTTYHNGSRHLATPEGQYDRWLHYHYQRNVLTEKVTQTDPAEINVGTDFDLQADTVLNDKSRMIIGGKLTGQIGSLTNIDGQGKQITQEMGSVTHFWRQEKKSRLFGLIRGGVSTGSHTTDYQPPDHVVDIMLQPAIQSTDTPPSPSAPPTAWSNYLDNSLFQQVKDPQAAYLVETDPRYRNYHQWLSSDTMLQQLASPAEQIRRLGDGFHEQRAVREQITQLTGRRFLPGFSSDEAQFQALMQQGVAEAKTQDLRLGVALTKAQIQRLDSDMVWLVKQSVRLPDGRVTEALVPKVYMRPGRVPPTAVEGQITADELRMILRNKLANQGRLASWQTVSIEAEDIAHTGGSIQGGKVQIVARNDIDMQGGEIHGDSVVDVIAGRDVLLGAQSKTTHSAQGSRTAISDQARIATHGENATLRLQAGRDIDMKAAQINNQGQGGSTQLIAGQDLNFGIITQQSQQTLGWDQDNWRQEARISEVGSRVYGVGDVLLRAGRDANLRGSHLTSEQGLIDLFATRDVNAQAARDTHWVDEAHRYTSRGWFSRTTTRTHDTVQQDLAQSSLLSGQRTDVEAGRHLGIEGSHVVSSQGTTMTAGQSMSIAAATNTLRENHHKQQTTSGLFSGGSFGVTLGTRQQTLNGQGVQQQAIESLVGATEGKVMLRAGSDYRQVGSHVKALKGDVDLSGSRVDILAARHSWDQFSQQYFKQTGLTLSLTNPVVSALQTSQQMVNGARQIDDPRFKLLAGATMGLAAKNAYDAVQQNPAQAGGINLNINLGVSQSRSNSEQHSNHSAASSIKGDNVNIIARGAGRDSNVTFEGSDAQAEKRLNIAADHQIRAIARADTDEQRSNSRQSSASVGFSIGSSGLLFNASAQGGRGRAEGQDLSWRLSQLIAGQLLQLKSGSDTQMIGARATAPRIDADIGGNLWLQSLQDLSRYTSRQQQYGISASFGAGMMMGSLTMGKTNMDSDYASVNQQTGLFAGDDGFDVRVQQHTELIGAAIASTEPAVQQGKNQLTTGTLSHRDIHNHANYQADTLQLGVGYSSAHGQVGKNQQGQAATGGAAVPQSDLPKKDGLSATLPIALSASDTTSSITRSGVSGATIHITDEASQQARTGQNATQTVASLNRDITTGRDDSYALKPIFDPGKIQAGFDIVGALGREVGTFIENRGKEIDSKRQAAQDAEQRAADPNQPLSDAQRLALNDQASRLRQQAADIDAAWGANGRHRQITTALVAGISGNVTGAGGEWARNTLVNYLQQQGAGYLGEHVANGNLKEGSPLHASLHAIVGCAGAAASQQSCNSGALGASASSVLTGLFSDSAADETQSQREAKRNLITSLVTGIVATGDPNAATANNAATAAVDNNWLATQQRVQMKQDLAQAKTGLEKLQVLGKWAQTSVQQDALTASGVAKGLAESGWQDLQGLAQFLSDPLTGLQGLKQLLTDPAVRQQFSEQVLKAIDHKIDRMQTALHQGGGQQAEQLGKDLGGLFWQVGSITTGVGGAAKGGVALAKAGVKVSAEGLVSLSNLAKFDVLLAKGGLFDTAGKPLMDFRPLSNAQKGVIGDLMGGKKIEQLIPGAQEIGRTPGIGHSGIDGLYKVDKPGVDYVVVEYKFGSSKQGMTLDGLQGSDDWLRGVNTGKSRILQSLEGNRLEAQKFSNAMDADRVEKWLVHTDPFGRVTVSIMGKDGKSIPNPQAASKILEGIR